MKCIRLFLLLIAAAAFMTSCKKSVPAQIKFIPKDAVFVATINTKSLQSKLEKNQATIENIIKNISRGDTTVNKGQQEWQDLKNSGVDLNENIYVAVVNKGGAAAGGKGAIITSAIAHLNDADKLEAYIKKKEPASDIRKEKDYNYTTMHGDKIIAWGHEVVMLMAYQKSFTTADMDYDSATGSFNLRSPANAVNDMKAEIDADFSLKEDQSVAAIPEFTDFMQEKADASVWINSSASMQQLPLPLPKMKELLSNSYTAAKVNFNDGKMVVDSRSYYSNDFTNLLKEYPGTTADLSLIENYPSDDINGFGVFSFNPQIIDGIVKYLEVGGVVDGYLSQMMGSNYTLPEALKAIKGDFAITVSDFSSQANTGSNNSRIPNVKMLLNIPVGDKVQMDRLMNKLVDMQFLIKTNGQYSLNTNLQKFGYQLHVDDKNVFITSDENLLNQYKAKSKKLILIRVL